ncbi:hypothetical protein [Thermus amyloliquefaciens]|uniref:hypothetical protein n=1 Tax=Thermus amyloliquefaciens TaxID=1449080 RepID=UPI0005718F84|nr:hypothetical protein [Thermus amyloliquefaciens]
MGGPWREGFPWGELQALLDPKAPPARRRRGLWLYAGFLFLLQGLGLLLLAPFFPQAWHPLLWALALLGAGWLFLQALRALREEGPLGALVAVGLGAALFFFLGVMGLLLRPWGLGLLPLGVLGFLHLVRRSEGGLKGPSGGPGSGP